MAIRPPVPGNETTRLAALQALRILDTHEEPVYDAIAALAASICETPIALISLVDRDRQWFKARVGLDVPETPRDVAFCAHAIVDPDPTEVHDASNDPRFLDNPLVVGDPNIRFYAGRPLHDRQGHALGTLCVIDRKPRQLSPAQRASMEHLATVVMRLFESRRELFQHSTALVTAQETLLHMAQHDSLTGLANRARLNEVLTETVARSRRHGTGCALLYLDLDHFKRINDGHGHAAGDAVLREFARRLRECARETDTVARLGGDEFVIVLEDLHDAEGAIMVAGKIREAMRESFEFEGASIDVSTSIGIAYGSLGEARLDNLLTRADRALYRVKSGGRGDFLLADDEDDDA